MKVLETRPAPPASTPAGAATGAVSLASLTKTFGGRPAVDALDLDVAPGEFVSLLGPSGCGKTTTLRLIAGFEFPDAGSIAVSGGRVEHLPPHKRPVNTVFQSYALFPHMSVADNVGYGPKLRRVPREEIRRRVTEALDLVRMTEYAARRPGQLSGGQQQRVALARALVNRPAVLLLDEPMSALDRKLREEMQVDLRLMQQDLGTTFVFVTHDQGEALTMSDRIAVMNGGRIEQIGAPAEVYDAPTTAFVAGFIGKQNFFSGTVLSVAAGADVTADGVTFRSSRPRAGDLAAGAAVTVAVRPDDVAVAAGQVPAGVNQVAGTVRAVSEIEHATHYVVETTGAGRVMAKTGRDGAPLPAGTEVTCSWPAHAVHVFSA